MSCDAIPSSPNTAVHCSKMVLMQITWRLLNGFVSPRWNMKRIGVIFPAARSLAAVSRCSLLQGQETFQHLSLCTGLYFIRRYSKKHNVEVAA